MRIQYDPIPVGGIRVAADVNGIYQAIHDAWPLDADNIREEGIDYSRFDPLLAAPGIGAGEGGTADDRTILANAAAYTTLVLGAHTIKTGAITLVAGDFLEVRGRVAMESRAAGTRGISDAIASFRFARTIAAVTTGVTFTEQSQSQESVALPGHFPVELLYFVRQATVLDDVRIQYKKPAGVLAVGSAWIDATLYRRVTT